MTLDYELFGDGSGNVFDNIIDPTERILSLCKDFNVRITIFFEVFEYLKLKHEWELGNKMNYSKNPAAAIKNQIKRA